MQNYSINNVNILSLLLLVVYYYKVPGAYVQNAYKSLQINTIKQNNKHVQFNTTHIQIAVCWGITEVWTWIEIYTTQIV